MSNVITDPCPICGEQLAFGQDEHGYDQWVCAWCDTVYIECPACDGVGEYFPHEHPAVRPETCPECDGEGIIEA